MWSNWCYPTFGIMLSKLQDIQKSQSIDRKYEEFKVFIYFVVFFKNTIACVHLKIAMSNEVYKALSKAILVMKVP